jgi:hypothetical protein
MRPLWSRSGARRAGRTGAGAFPGRKFAAPLVPLRYAPRRGVGVELLMAAPLVPLRYARSPPGLRPSKTRAALATRRNRRPRAFGVPASGALPQHPCCGAAFFAAPLRLVRMSAPGRPLAGPRGRANRRCDSRHALRVAGVERKGPLGVSRAAQSDGGCRGMDAAAGHPRQDAECGRPPGGRAAQGTARFARRATGEGGCPGTAQRGANIDSRPGGRSHSAARSK